MLGVLARRLPGGQTVTSQETLMTPAPSPDVTVSDSGPSYVRRLGRGQISGHSSQAFLISLCC